MQEIIQTPDKMSYKTTVTSVLRSQIFDIAIKRGAKSYLEIGCDHGFTLIALSRAFEAQVGIDIDSSRVISARENAKAHDVDAQFIVGTSKDIPAALYDVVLIDAAHDYENVKNDFANVRLRNLADEYVVVFHDYGLVNAGVKLAVQTSGFSFDLLGMEANWNPMGGQVTDYEAAMIVVKRD